MTAWSFILRGLRHYRASYLGVLIGSALGAMVLLGAMFAGDSVKSTLRQIAEQRTGLTTLVLTGGENFFRASLSDSIPATAPVLQLRAQVDRSDSRSIGQVDIFGVSDSFWSFAPEETPPPEFGSREFAINRELARSLDLATGDSLVIRLPKPGLASHDAPLSGEEEELITIRGTIRTILEDSQMGRFGLTASQIPTPKIFLPLERLAEAIERPDRANLLLFRDKISEEEATEKVRISAQLADYGLSLKDIPSGSATEIRSDRIFIPPAIEAKAFSLFPDGHPVTTYLVNTIAANGKETPYSMVTGVSPDATGFLPEDLEDDQIVLNAWEADDLGAKPGDPLTLTYYILGKNGLLVEESADFRVHSIVPLEGAAADQLWMPDFPGIAEADNSSDWTPGLPLDLTRIREKDETYWDDHRGTPKAFISERRAKDLWQNRWGSATSLRFSHASTSASELEQGLLGALVPADAGLLVRDLHDEAQTAASSPVDIASLFLSMSFFLILAAVALTAMLFRFNLEQRNAETGLLAALGIPANKILRWRLLEGLIVVALGATLGAILALAYTRGLLLFLERIWSSGGDPLFRFDAAPTSIIGGILGFIILMMLTIWLVSRKQAKRSASLRLASGSEEIPSGRGTKALWALVVIAIATVAATLSSSALPPQLSFFLAGFSILIGGLSLYRLRLNRRSSSAQIDPARIARLNSARRPTRSLVVVGTLAAGLFLVVSVTAFQKHGGDGWKATASEAGGYSLWIETTNPVSRNAHTHQYFEDQDSSLQNLLPIRVGRGDDASCFNLNSVSHPRLLATDTNALEKRGAFTIKATAPGIEKSWAALREGETMRAFLDETTLLWVLKKKLGDRIDYIDEQGATFPVEIAGTLAGSVFQGSFIVDEQAFLSRYPSAAGPRLFLADTVGDPDSARIELQKTLTDLGATITPTADRIAAFHSVENTYISIFNILGGLGVILGSAGLGIVTARNLAERKDEFATLLTIGIPQRKIRSIVFKETRQFILWAVAIGLSAAIVSILPALPSTGKPALTIAWILGFTLLIVLTAALFAALAYKKTRVRALAGQPTPASRA